MGERARTSHAAMGLPIGKMVVCENGFERGVDDFSEVHCVKRALSLARERGALVIGMVARYHPQKDHKAFLEALSIPADTGQDFVAVLAGTGLTKENKPLCDQLERFGLGEKVVLLGELKQSSSLHSRLDVH